jgi:trehalose-6-phosphate hydrolase
MWWENAVFYEIYIASFADSDGDGVGDINGIREKLTYLKQCGIDALWLTPFYPSPKVDNGYDVSDYCNVDSQYGTLENFDLLVEEAHQLEIKIIIDVVLNHTSTKHPWFVESASSTENPKRDWYIWRNQSNNWESFFGGTAWKYDNNTKQYYYHSFAEEQADLNWQNPEVKQAIFNVLQFLLSRGVDGFRFDVINNLTVNAQFQDNPMESGTQLHQYDINQLGINAVLKEIIQWVKGVNSEVFTVAEISSDDLSLINRYTERGLFDTAFHFNLGSIEDLTLEKMVGEFKKMSGQEKIPTLFFNSHDMSRSWNRLAKEDFNLYQLLAVFLLINRGIPFLFQGEEQGVGDYLPQKYADIRDIQAKNKYNKELFITDEKQAIYKANQVNRDRSRGMIPWSQIPQRGWIGSGLKNKNAQEILEKYRYLIQLRKIEGPFKILTNIELKGECLSYQLGKIHVVLNFGRTLIKQPLQAKMETLFGEGRISDNGCWLYVPSKACWIGKENT